MKSGNVISRYLSLAFVFSFCFQGFHLIEEPTPIRPFMVLLPMVFFWLFVKGSRVNFVFSELMACVFFFFMLISIFWAEVPSLALLKMVGIFLLTSSYFCVRSGLRTIDDQEFAKCISYGGVVVLSLSLAYYFLGIFLFDESATRVTEDGFDRFYLGVYIEGYLVRMRGLFDSPNNLALVCVFLYLYYDSKSSYFKTVGKALAVLSLILTISVTGWIALLAAVFFKLLYKRKFLPVVAGLLGVSASVLAILTLMPDDVREPLVENRMERVETGSGRLELFEFTIERALDRPILGYGLNQSRTLYVNFRGFQSSHNSFLEALVDGGLVGLTLYLGCWLAVIAFCYQITRSREEPFFLSAAIALLFFSQANLLTYVELNMLYFAMVFDMARRRNLNKLMR